MQRSLLAAMEARVLTECAQVEARLVAELQRRGDVTATVRQALELRVEQLRESTAEALGTLHSQLSAVADTVPTPDRMDTILRMLYDVEQYISENRKQRDEVIDAELEAVHVRLRTMAGEMAAKADTVTVTKAVDTLDDSVQRLSLLEGQFAQRSARSLEAEERSMLKATAAEATCRRLASDAMARSKTICDRVLEAVAALECKVDSHTAGVTAAQMQVRWKGQ